MDSLTTLLVTILIVCIGATFTEPDRISNLTLDACVTSTSWVTETVTAFSTSTVVLPTSSLNGSIYHWTNPLIHWTTFPYPRPPLNVSVNSQDSTTVLTSAQSLSTTDTLGAITTNVPLIFSTLSSIRSIISIPSSANDSAITSKSSTPSTVMSSIAMPPTPVSKSLTVLSPNSTPIGCQRSAASMNYTPMGSWYGVNVVNSKPGPNQHSLGPKRDTSDWDLAFKNIKALLPNINAVRLYSTMDWNGTSPEWLYLDNALPAARKYGLKVLAGAWAGGLEPDQKARFSAERDALATALQNYGCDDIVAVSVGNEDLNDINEMKDLTPEQISATKQEAVDLLVEQMNETRAVLDSFGCCNVPVTHTDTWNEIFNDTDTNPWVSQLIQACDSFVIINIFPYWQNTTLAQAWDYLTTQSAMVLNTTAKYGRDIWLGETGWPRQVRCVFPSPANCTEGLNQGLTKDDYIQDQNQEASGVANTFNHQQYFVEIGCQILSGNGSAFYYVDWDEDAPLLDPPRPAFGISRYDGSPLIDLSCQGFKPSMIVQETWPRFLGGKGILFGRGEGYQSVNGTG